MCYIFLICLSGCYDRKEQLGCFYELAEAYDLGYLSSEDIEKLYDNYNDGYTLKLFIKENRIIKDDYLKSFYNKYFTNRYQIEIKEYYGTYNGCKVMVVGEYKFTSVDYPLLVWYSDKTQSCT